MWFESGFKTGSDGNEWPALIIFLAVHVLLFIIRCALERGVGEWAFWNISAARAPIGWLGRSAMFEQGCFIRILCVAKCTLHCCPAI